MTGRPAMPTENDVRAALTHLRATSGRLSVLGLARHVGLANTTFRRHFPHICAELTTTDDATHDDGRSAMGSQGRLAADNTRLRADNRELRAQLALAVASIQRLSLDNQSLRDELHAASKITTITPRR